MKRDIKTIIEYVYYVILLVEIVVLLSMIPLLTVI